MDFHHLFESFAVAAVLDALLYLPAVFVLTAVIAAFVLDLGQTVQQPALLLVG